MGNGRYSWKVRVVGRVQGVYYRAFTRESARELGVAGWVRNEPDGSVLALIQHVDPQVLAQMVARMKLGPPAAVVESIEREEVNESRNYTGFRIDL